MEKSKSSSSTVTTPSTTSSAITKNTSETVSTKELENQSKLNKLLLAKISSLEKITKLEKEEEKTIDEVSEAESDAIKKAKEKLSVLNANKKILTDSMKIQAKQNALDDVRIKLDKNQISLKKAVNKLKEQGFDIDEKAIKSNKDLIQLSNAGIKIDRESLKILKDQTEEFKKQKSEATKKMGLGEALKKDLSSLGKSVWTRFAGAFSLLEGLKGLKQEADNVYDSFWRLGQPMDKMDGSLTALTKKTVGYETTLISVKNTASAYGYDTEKVEEAMVQLTSKVKFMADGVNGVDFDAAGEAEKSLIGYAQEMGISMEDAIDTYTLGIRKFGKNETAFRKEMSNAGAATIMFNGIMGKGSIFASEVAEHLLQVQRNTRYWVQDMGMLNTQFNTHVALLIKQGKSQEQAMKQASKFQDMMQNPPDLIKWNAGTAIVNDLRRAMKGAKDEKEAMAKMAKTLGIQENDATGMSQVKTMYDAMTKGHNTQFTQANMAQELFGGTKGGANRTLQAYSRYANMDATVLTQLGFGENASEAESMRQLIKSLQTMGIDNATSMDEAIAKLAEQEKKKNGWTDKQKDDWIKQNQERFKKAQTTGDDGKAKEVEFRSNTVYVLGVIKNFVESNLVKTALGAIISLPPLVATIAGTNVIQTLGGFKNMMGGMKRGLTKTRYVTKGQRVRAADKIENKGNQKLGDAAKTRQQAKALRESSRNIESSNPYVARAQENEAKRLEQRALKQEQKAQKYFDKSKSVREDIPRGSATKATEKVARRTAERASERTVERASEKAAMRASEKLVARQVESSVAKSGVKSLLKGGAKAALRGTGVGTALVVGMEGYDNFYGENASKRSTKAKVARTGISAVGALGGAAAGAAIGSVVPVVGTLIGGIVGGIAGSMLANKANDKFVSDTSEGNQSEKEKKRIKQEKYTQEQYQKAQKQQQKEAMIARAIAEKQAYDQLDDLGKLRKTQEDMYKLQDKWFQFSVESEVRSILDNTNLDNTKKMRRLKGISTGAAGMQRMTQAVDASGMTTIRIVGAKNIQDQRIYSDSEWQN